MARGKPLDGSKNPGGKPRIYPEVEALKQRIDDYFNSITINKPRVQYVTIGYEDDEKKIPIVEERPVLNNSGEQVIDTVYFENPSVIGMCLFLGLHKETLRLYEKEEKYFATIKSAKHKIEKYLESELFRGQGQVTGIIFNLKNNFGWVDKQEIEMEVDGKMQIAITGAVKEWGR